MSGRSSAIDPSSLTVAELKKELTRNGVEFGSKKVKQYYVDLFKEKVQNASSTNFSSDEEDAGQRKAKRRSQARSRSSLGRPPTTRTTNDLSVETLSDSELRQELILRGEHPGPVTTLTRALYERQLRNLLGQNEQSSKASARSTQSQSLPATPMQLHRRSARQTFEMSGDEADSGKTPARAQRSVRATPRRRTSELDRLRMEAPGPKSVLAFKELEPLAAHASSTPLTRRVTQRLRQERQEVPMTSKAAVPTSTTATPSASISAWAGLLVVIALGVVTFLLFNGYLLKIPVKQ